ncbi:MAG: hypothetical protein IT305_19940 [Chloroflexi bacterium]|nr:hypothetical protein [Chloroflexota bacterium]
MVETWIDITAAEAIEVAEILGIDWALAPYDVEQFCLGITIERQHALLAQSTPLADLDTLDAARYAMARLHDLPDYYTRLTTAHSPGDGQFGEFARDDVGRD